jgi:hypothetical protein
MTSPLRTPEDYELFLYTLQDQFESIRSSTVTFVRRGNSLARVSGQITFDYGIRLVIVERILFDRLPALIDGYGYEVWREEEKLYWYDSQPHPDGETLQINHPHHKHIPPDIKHNRVPAPEIGFSIPNIPKLIEEIEELIQSIEEGDPQAS